VSSTGTTSASAHATDLASRLFDWQRQRLASEGTAVSGGAERLVRIVEIAGDDGLRRTVAYAAIARLALSVQRGEHDQLETWRQVSDAILGLVHWPPAACGYRHS